MILALRQRHRRVFAALGIFLPVAIAVSVAIRKPVPVAASLPKGLAGSAERTGVTVWERADLFPKVPVRVRLSREDAKGELAVDFRAGKDFVKPDLLVYWSAQKGAASDSLPADARLLGTFSGGGLKLPAGTALTDGSLVLYSLANQEVVDVSGPVRLNLSTK
ncbi:MAG TPA: hypothetical protein VHH73_14665 [Verrucomicrobiae bacterium]|nr:hypothetical protein [Verrucomicrobiae bacterium]